MLSGETTPKKPEIDYPYDSLEFIRFCKEHFSSYVVEKMTTIAQHLYETGWELGVKEGRLTGIQEGKHKHAIETAFKLIQLGYDNESVADISGLNLQEIKSMYVE